MIPDFPIDIRIRLAELDFFLFFLTSLILCPVGCFSKTEQARGQKAEKIVIFLKDII